MRPTRKITKGPLFLEATSRRALRRAWENVKPRVLRSKDPKIRAVAESFSRDAERSICELQHELRNSTFIFPRQHGVLKYKKPKLGQARKDPRPIVVAPVTSRVVQRALLDVCQSGQEKITRRLGLLPHVIATPTSVGGLPGRGVPEAMTLITNAIASGAKWFIRSDLKKFFQTIPKPHIENFFRSNAFDNDFVDLFMQALATELENENEIRELISLFPIGPIGVPQGSALSALCANIVLHDFDVKLNGRGICTVRYLDDFVILGPDKIAVTKAWGHAQAMLKSLGMECHDPNAGTGKAAMGEIAYGFEFLSFYVDDKDLSPSKKAREEFLADLSDTIRNARREIAAVKDHTRRAEPRFIQSLNLLDQKIRGWGDAFSPTTKRVIFAQLDSEIEKLISDYLNWFRRMRVNRSKTHQRRMLGIALLTDTAPPRS